MAGNRVLYLCDRLGAMRPRQTTFIQYALKLTENNVVTALNRSEYFMVRHLAREVDIGIHAKEHRPARTGTNGHGANHSLLPLRPRIRYLD